jgi:hypothetical protein
MAWLLWFAGFHQREAHRLLTRSAQLSAPLVKGMFGDPALPAKRPHRLPAAFLLCDPLAP